jgi:hypothetical protein
MEGKFDSREQLFPGVHHRDANAVRRSSPQQPQWVGGTGRWRVSNPSRVAHRRRRGLVARHSIGWPGRPACQHVGHGGHHNDRCRARRLERRCARTRRRRCRTDHHRIVGWFSVSVSQSGDSVGISLGANRRGREAPAAGPSSDATFGLGRPQAAGVEATDRRAQAGTEAAVRRRVVAAQHHFPAVETSRTRQRVLHLVHTIVTLSESVAHSVSIHYCDRIAPARTSGSRI